MKFTKIFLLITALLMCSLPAVAFEISKSQAANKALVKYPGKLLSTKTVKGKKGKVYLVKILMKDGRVKTVKVNADSGKISR